MIYKSEHKGKTFYLIPEFCKIFSEDGRVLVAKTSRFENLEEVKEVPDFVKKNLSVAEKVRLQREGYDVI